jgi:hypothetical protein
MTRRPSVLRPALQLLRGRLVLQQLGLALLVFLLYALWLRMPDASVIDVIGSVVLALVILVVAGVGESSLILRLVGTARSPRGLLRGSLLLFVGAARISCETSFRSNTLCCGWDGCGLLSHGSAPA